MNSSNLYKVGLILIVGLSLSLLSACGSGGGGGDDTDEFLGAADVSIKADPETVDTADRTLVTVKIREVHENGILLKIRYPSGLTYVTSSALLEADGDEIDVSPSVNTTSENSVYLVFFLDQDIFGDDAEGILKIELQGVSEVIDGLIEVDADVNDPLVSDSSEFSVDAPGFGAEDEANIEVVD